MDRVGPLVGVELAVLRINARMIGQQFPADDELFQMAEKAQVQRHALVIKVHELGGRGLPE